MMTLAATTRLASGELQLVASKSGDEKLLTIDSHTPVTNPPSEVANTPPTLDTFNKIYQSLFDGRMVDIAADGGLAKIAEYVQHESSNGLYAKLKKREKEFHGAVLIFPFQSDKEQIIAVYARVLFVQIGKDPRVLFSPKERRVLRSEVILIHFTPKGTYKNVDKGIGTRQELD